MHCPNCGKKASNDQKYCRSCGMTMTEVSQLLNQHLSTVKSRRIKPQRDQELLRRMGKIMFAGISMFIIGLAMLGFNKTGPVGMFGLVVTLLGTLVMAYSVISPLWQAGVAPKISAATTKELNESAIFLPEQRNPVPMPSVTESTTRRLEIGKPSKDERVRGEIKRSTH